MKAYLPWDSSNPYLGDTDFDDDDLLELVEDPGERLTIAQVVKMAGGLVTIWNVRCAIGRDHILRAQRCMVGGHRMWLIAKKEAERWLRELSDETVLR